MDFWLYDMVLFDSKGNSVIDSNQFNISSISHCISFLFIYILAIYSYAYNIDAGYYTLVLVSYLFYNSN